MVEFFTGCYSIFIDLVVHLIENDFFHGVVMGIIFCVTVGTFGNKHFTLADMLDLLFDDRINYNPVRENDHNEVQ